MLINEDPIYPKKPKRRQQNRNRTSKKAAPHSPPAAPIVPVPLIIPAEIILPTTPLPDRYWIYSTPEQRKQANTEIFLEAKKQSRDVGGLAFDVTVRSMMISAEKRRARGWQHES